MYKYWITYTIASVIFFIICLTLVIFNNNPVFSHFWEEALFIASVLNLGLLFTYYSNHKHDFKNKK